MRVRTYPGGVRTPDVTPTDSDLVLNQYYRVRELNQKEVADAGGRLEDGMIQVGPITPSNGAGVGYTIAQIAPDETADGIEVYYILTGAIVGEYARVSVNTYRPFRYELILTRRRTTP